MQSSGNLRKVRIFRYDPETGGEGHFQDYSLNIEKPELTTLLDVLLRIQREQDPTIAFRLACRVNMCGSCGVVINGREALACKVNVVHLPTNQDITIRPMNHFPVIKDLVVDMDPFFRKYEDTLPFFEPKEKRDEPYLIKPDDPLRVDIGMSTDCIACGCCVSSCTMVNQHEGYAGPAALNRAFTLLADERDALFVPRLTRALDSCYSCRTEFNCTEVCPKSISGTRAIKYIQRLALKNLKDVKPLPLHPVEETAKAKPRPEAKEEAPCCCHGKAPDASRRSFLLASLVGAGVALSLGGILAVSAVRPTLSNQPKQWVPAGPLESFTTGSVTTVMLNYTRTQAFHKEQITVPVLVRRDGEKEFIFFSSSCPHLACAVAWDPPTRRFKCACHGGAFDINGAVVAGPPPAPLERLPWKIENGEVLVEVS